MFIIFIDFNIVYLYFVLEILVSGSGEDGDLIVCIVINYL